MINLFRLTYVSAGITGIILLIIGFALIVLMVLPNSKQAKALNVSNNNILFLFLSLIFIVLGLINFIIFIKFVRLINIESFMIGPNRLTAEQYDNTKLMSTQGRLQKSREMLAKSGYPFNGLETHETHLKENFIAQNLPLWTEK
jgi:hypothetical protein